MLFRSDPALLDLQRGAGGELGQLLAVPQLAAIARLAARLGIPVSRPALVSADECDIEMWVRAKPAHDGVMLAIADWQERPPRLPSSQDTPVIGSASGEARWLWRTDADLRVAAFEKVAMDGLGAVDPEDAMLVVGQDFVGSFDLGASGVQGSAMLSAMARRHGFDAELITSNGSHCHISGIAMFDMAGAFQGYRGQAVHNEVANEGELAPATVVPSEVTRHDPLLNRKLDEALRQPLVRIIANADTISHQLQGPLRREYAAYASDISLAGRHLMELIDDLADLQVVDRPDFSVASEEVDLADIGRRTAGLLGVKASERNIRINAPGEDESVIAIGEFRRILQVLVNLVTNAIRYSPQYSMVWIRTEMIGDTASITVADQGAGLSDEDQQRIFEKFERLGRSDAAGSGLGLYISRRLAHAMQGKLSVDSAPGQGARFTLTLPAAPK